MTNSAPKYFGDIDWPQLRANALAQKGWKKKSAQDWDQKAGSFSIRNKNSEYINLFLEHLPLNDKLSVLDIGSGPGTLALPIARKVAEVTAIDFSGGMLDSLAVRAKEEQISNIRTVCCSWEDDWQASNITAHDIAIASRSIGVNDLEKALKKINAYAKKFVFLSDRIGATPFEAEAFNAIGRDFLPGPDYIYTLNILYTLGIYPNVSVLKLPQDLVYPSIEEAMDSFIWMFHDISDGEKSALKKYVQSCIVHEEENSITLRRKTPPQWALIWWEK